MSQENVEMFRLAVDAWNRQDIEGILAFADPEIEYVNAPGAVEPGTKRGRDGMRLCFERNGTPSPTVAGRSIEFTIAATR
jgi:hypothetical protein